MSDEKLTQDDPITQEEYEELIRLEDAIAATALRNLALDREKIALLGVAKRLTDKRNEVFAGVLVARGLSPEVRAEVDEKTRRLIIVDQDGPAQE